MTKLTISGAALGGGWIYVTGQPWQLPQTSVLSCPYCGHRLCGSCYRLRRRTRKSLAEWQMWERNYIRCCSCPVASTLEDWFLDQELEKLAQKASWNQTKPRRTVSQNQFDRKGIDLDLEVARGLTTQREADDELSRWEKLPGGRYQHEEETLKRLAGESKE
jgi:hypothetical protein